MNQAKHSMPTIYLTALLLNAKDSFQYQSGPKKLSFTPSPRCKRTCGDIQEGRPTTYTQLKTVQRNSI